MNDFMSRKVQTIFSDSNVTRAVKLMVEKNIGSVVVVDNTGPKGIFTERDLLSKVLARGRRIEEPIIEEVMSTSFASLELDRTLSQAARSMIARKGMLLIFENSELVGIVTATDMIRAIYKLGRKFDLSRVVSKRVTVYDPDAPVELVALDMAQKRIGSVLVGHDRSRPEMIFTERDLLKKVLGKNLKLDTRVAEVATSPLITGKVGIDGIEAAGLMVEKRIKRLPLFNDDNSIFGIVTARDLVEAFSKH